jgi:hypothetical protein
MQSFLQQKKQFASKWHTITPHSFTSKMYDHTKQFCSGRKPSDLYLRGTKFESWPGRLNIVTVVFLSPFKLLPR